MNEQQVSIPIGAVTIEGDLAGPDGAHGVVVFAHGSGSGRHSPRNRFVARQLQAGGLVTLLIDLLTEDEEDEERYTRHLRFDIELLAGRLLGASRWVEGQPGLAALPLGYFGASTGAAAALVAAARAPDRVAAVVSRGGRPDLAGAALAEVRAPTLLIVGGNDPQVIRLNQLALARLGAPGRLETVPHASHLFEEPGTLAQAAELARQWFADHLRVAATAETSPRA